MTLHYRDKKNVPAKHLHAFGSIIYCSLGSEFAGKVVLGIE